METVQVTLYPYQAFQVQSICNEMPMRSVKLYFNLAHSLYALRSVMAH